MLPEEILDRTDRYLRQEMTAEEAATFEAEMENDEDLRRQTEFIQRLKEELADRHQRMKRMEEWDHKASTRHRRKLTAWISGIAAAAIIALLLTTIHHRTDDTIQLAHVDATASRGNSGFSHIRQLINNGSYQEALNAIEDEKAKNMADMRKVERDSTLNDGQRSYKMTIVKTDADELVWMEAHALIGMNQKEKASAMLAQLVKNKGFYSEQADSLLKLLQ